MLVWHVSMLGGGGGGGGRNKGYFPRAPKLLSVALFYQFSYNFNEVKQPGNNNQTVYLYVPLAVLTSLYPQMLENVSVLALLFLELCLELCS